ncbi:MAG: hypothetical protein FVQ77_02265 [Cytophagales bacterium]|nr:hypothetical protein [Cytophagales bacterium]
MNVRDYFQTVESELHSTPLVISIDFHTEVIDINFGYFKSRITFFDSSRLYLFELVKIVKDTSHIEKYRYHYQGKNNKLIKRWDNAPHFHKLTSFPDHLHIGSKVLECTKPEIKDIMLDVIKQIEYGNY